MEATRKQAAFLEQLDLLVPPDKWAASCLLDFALHGNGSCDQDPKVRRVLIRKFWRRWVGKTVKIIHFRHRFQGACGRVEYLRARTEEEVRRIIAAYPIKKPFPFVAVVRLDSVVAKFLVEIHLTGLSKRVRERQMKLFPL